MQRSEFGDSTENDPNLEIQRKYMASELDLSRNLLEIFRVFYRCEHHAYLI